MIAHCSSTSNIGLDAPYHTAYPSGATTLKGTLTFAKVHYKFRVACSLNLPWYGMEYGRKFQYRMEDGMEVF